MDKLKTTPNTPSMSYSEYRDMMGSLLAEGKTTGPNQSEAYIEYTNMSERRMKRLDKKAEVSEELQTLLEKQGKQRWLVITEAWCGDASQNLPYFNKMAEASPNISLELVLRDENIELMDEFLTNGGRSIPKLIALNEEDEVLFSWGPRPQMMQEVYSDMRSKEVPYSEISVKIHTMYAKDKGVELQKEFVELFKASS